MGFTEAELGFFLLLVALGAVFTSTATKPPKGPVSRETYDSVLRVLSVARDSLRKLDSLTSRLTPDCKEKGLVHGPLFSVAIAAQDRFVVDEQSVTMDGILRRYEIEMRAAKDRGCIYEVAVRYADGLTPRDLWRGLRRLRAQFHTTMEQ